MKNLPSNSVTWNYAPSGALEINQSNLIVVSYGKTVVAVGASVNRTGRTARISGYWANNGLVISEMTPSSCWPHFADTGRMLCQHQSFCVACASWCEPIMSSCVLVSLPIFRFMLMTKLGFAQTKVCFNHTGTHNYCLSQMSIAFFYQCHSIYPGNDSLISFALWKCLQLGNTPRIIITKGVLPTIV